MKNYGIIELYNNKNDKKLGYILVPIYEKEQGVFSYYNNLGNKNENLVKVKPKLISTNALKLSIMLESLNLKYLNFNLKNEDKKELFNDNQENIINNLFGEDFNMLEFSKQIEFGMIKSKEIEDARKILNNKQKNINKVEELKDVNFAYLPLNFQDHPSLKFIYDFLAEERLSYELLEEKNM